MKKIITIAISLTTLIIVAFVSGAVYVISETSQVVITQFGKPVGDPITDAGLHFKMPFIQHVHHFDKRLLPWDGDPNQIPTRDKRYLWVDTTARWKIVDAQKFLQSVGSEHGAHAKLDNIVNSATRGVITRHTLVEIIRDTNRIIEERDKVFGGIGVKEDQEKISTGREKIEGAILEKAKELVPLYGIELVDVRIKRVDYVEEVRRKVYERMISERKRAAEEYRSEGRGKSAEIKGKMEKELKNITSSAYKTAQEINGQADAKAINIYAEAYNNDPEFYSFLRTLETYRNTLGKGTTILLTTDSEYLKYLNKAE